MRRLVAVVGRHARPYDGIGEHSAGPALPGPPYAVRQGLLGDERECPLLPCALGQIEDRIEEILRLVYRDVNAEVSHSR